MASFFDVDQKLFPCPICLESRPVSLSKKGKPYIVCNKCGVQLFVRNNSGIRQLESMIDKAESHGTMAEKLDLEERYRRECPKCRNKFWVRDDLIATSILNGKFLGYRCPECNEVAGKEQAR
jgi:predicted nucleic-acid-binding Zn-ribbon protein